LSRRRGEEELENDELVELAMAGGQDHAHATFSKDASDLVRAENHVADLEGLQSGAPRRES
jgi:hypothetical protein